MKKLQLRLCGAAVAVTVLLLRGSTFAQENSGALVGELVKLMAAAKADSVAAQHPAAPDQFVGALYFPGSQLLVVTARYSAPTLLVDKIARKAYQDVYIDLNSASIPASKIFISDLGADGLKARRQGNEAFDTVEISGKTQVLDGDWDKAKISEKDYMTTFSRAEEEYVRMLRALLTQMKKPS